MRVLILVVGKTGSMRETLAHALMSTGFKYLHYSKEFTPNFLNHDLVALEFTVTAPPNIEYFQQYAKIHNYKLILCNWELLRNAT